MVESTGIEVIAVGAGFAGLTAAIECVRHGHKVTLLESFPDVKALGDIISFGANAGRIFKRWDGVEEKLDRICLNTKGINFKTYLGEDVYYQEWTPEETFGKPFNGHRGEIHEIVYEYAQKVGVNIILGHRVTDYFETETEAGVIANGQRFTADVVFAADGVRSKGRQIVLGYDDKPKSSGYAIFRTWFPSDKLANNPLTKFMCENGDNHCAWLGPDIHFIAATIKGGKDFSWVCTHKDEADIEESWQTPGKIEDALKVLEGWDPAVLEIVKATPPESLVDWKLVYRDPLPTWVSPKSRIALIGDAAHPFLPTSIQGASQAMEDGATLAVCLELAGKSDVALAILAYEKIRYQRVLMTQKTGESTREKWHKADFANLKEKPDTIKLQRGEWMLGHDAEKHAYEVYAETIASLDR
ncbi:putative monooxygenase [Kockiozyma suomiensis]|uniref:putative monooxygenase n=1 Tax=Kockiozyma suomiensis TaxID=1337062 RepID=UPI003343FA83